MGEASKAIGVDAADLVTPAVNTAAVRTLPAVASRSHVVAGVRGSYSAAPTGGGVTIESPASTFLFDFDVPNTLIETDFAVPVRFPANTAVVITLKAAGAAVAGKLNMGGMHWLE